MFKAVKIAEKNGKNIVILNLKIVKNLYRLFTKKTKKLRFKLIELA